MRLLGPALAASAAALSNDGSEEAADCSEDDDVRLGFTDVEVLERAHSTSASSDDDLEGFAHVEVREDSPAVEDVKKQEPVVDPPTTSAPSGSAPLHTLPVVAAASAAAASCSKGQFPVAAGANFQLQLPPPPPPPVARYSLVSLESVECAHAEAPDGSPVAQAGVCTDPTSEGSPRCMPGSKPRLQHAQR